MAFSKAGLGENKDKSGSSQIIGRDNDMVGQEHVVIGNNNTNAFGGTAEGDHHVIVGANNRTNGNINTMLGRDNQTNGQANTLLGQNNQLGHLVPTKEGKELDAKTARSNMNNSILLGSNSIVDKVEAINSDEGNAVLVGNKGKLIGLNNVAVGNEIIALGSDNALLGYQAKGYGNNNLVMGTGAKAGEENTKIDLATVLGTKAKVTQSNSVAIGANSAAERVIDQPQKDKGVVGEVSFGADGKYRVLTHIAEGVDDHDAVNVAQLKAIKTTVESQSKPVHLKNGGAEAFDLGSDATLKLTSDANVSIETTKAKENSPNTIKLSLKDDLSAKSLTLTGENDAKVKLSIQGKALSTNGQSVVVSGESGLSSTLSTDGLTVKSASKTSVYGADQLTISTKDNGPKVVLTTDALTFGKANGLKSNDKVLGLNAQHIAFNSQATVETPKSDKTLGMEALDNSEAPKGLVNFDGRRLQNVAAGLIGEHSLDAVNGGQLFSVREGLIQKLSSAGIGDNTNKGDGNQVTGKNNVVDGTQGTTKDKESQGNVVTGKDNQSIGKGNVITGQNNKVGEDGKPANGNTVTGSDNTVGGNDNTVNGSGIQTTGDENVVIGKNAKNNGNGNTVVGARAEAKGDNASAYGKEAKAEGDNTLAIGAGSKAKGEGNVALGAGSVAEASIQLGDTGNTSQSGGVISVGSKDKLRVITGVADGRVAKGSTDAINGNQLFERTQGFTLKVGETTNKVNYRSVLAVKGDKNIQVALNNDKENSNLNIKLAPDVTLSSITLGEANGLKIDTEGLTRDGSIVLKSTNNDVFFVDEVSKGTSWTAGTDQYASFGNKETLTQLSGFAGAKPVGRFMVGNVDAPRRVQGVAAGLIDEHSLDAVNGSQLYKVIDAVNDFKKKGTGVRDNDNNVVIGGKANGEEAPKITAGGKGNTLIGDKDTTVKGNDSVITGGVNNVVGDRTVVTGTMNHVNTTEGSPDAKNGSHNVVVGVHNTVSGGHNGTFGEDNMVSGQTNTVLGHGNGTTGDANKVISDNSVVNGGNNAVMGTGNNVKGDSNVVIGNKANVEEGDNNVVLGTEAKAGTASSSVALGHGSSVEGKNNVALGSTSQAETLDFEDPLLAEAKKDKAFGVVSVGNNDNTRLITNVAGARLTETSTDAVNGRQLYEVKSEIAAINGKSANKDGNVTLGAQVDEKGDLSKVASVDPKAKDATAIGSGSNVAANGGSAFGNGAKVTGENGTAIGKGAEASGNNVAIGAGSKATGTIQLGEKGSTNTSKGVVSVGSKDGLRVVTGVADGKVAKGSTDAVNGNQLAALRDTPITLRNAGGDSVPVKLGDVLDLVGDENLTFAVEEKDGKRVLKVQTKGSVVLGQGEHKATLSVDKSGAANISSQHVALGSQAAVQTEKTSKTAGATDLTQDVAIGDVTMKVENMAGTKASGVVSLGKDDEVRRLQNVAAGLITKESTDAVNGSQVYELANQLKNVSSVVSSDNDGNINIGGKVDNAKNSTTLGKDSQVVGNDSTAIGSGAKAKDGATAIGKGATAEGDNNVAIGKGSVAMPRDNLPEGAMGVVSVGNDKGTRVITGVADGSKPTDAVNVRQLEKTFNQFGGAVNSRINAVQREARSGIAAATAMANLPTVNAAGRSAVSLGVGTFRSVSAMAIGGSHMTENGKMIIKFSGSISTEGDASAGAGVGFVW